VISQIWTAPNQLTLLRLIFVPFAAIAVLDEHYGWAILILIAAGISDGLDGLLARVLHQHTQLGQYLDPIADKLLLSTMFIVLSLDHKIPWRVTVLVFTRDVGLLLIAAVFFAIASVRNFKPSLWGKMNTAVQIVTVFMVLLYEVYPTFLVAVLRRVALWSTVAFTIISSVHYMLRAGAQLRGAERSSEENVTFKVTNTQ
jgi:cardiolipin synthase